jgi:hypothetical protein
VLGEVFGRTIDGIPLRDRRRDLNAQLTPPAGHERLPRRVDDRRNSRHRAGISVKDNHDEQGYRNREFTSATPH